jgi:hypothetical protein
MKLIRRLAGGSRACPKNVRDACIRIMTGYTDEYDVELVTNYIENL